MLFELAVGLVPVSDKVWASRFSHVEARRGDHVTWQKRPTRWPHQPIRDGEMGKLDNCTKHCFKEGLNGINFSSSFSFV